MGLNLPLRAGSSTELVPDQGGVNTTLHFQLVRGPTSDSPGLFRPGIKGSRLTEGTSALHWEG